LPIVDNKKLVGFITAIDILNFMSKNKNFSSQLSNSIESLMIKNVYTVKKNEDVSNVIKIFEKYDIGGLPVVDESNTLEGIITERDILEEIV
jgi:CBS domain-containing protein